MSNNFSSCNYTHSHYHILLNPFNLATPLYNQQQASVLIAELQNTIHKQQIIINKLMADSDTQKPEEKVPNTEPANQVKIEIDSLSESLASLKQEPKLEDSYNSEMRSVTSSKMLSNNIRKPKMKKRHRFKPSRTYSKIKTEDNTYSDLPQTELTDKNVHLEDNGKLLNLSKAKHLWINYGRRILDHAFGQISAAMQYRLKPFIGKLSSKKDFEAAFRINETDSIEDKAFKKTFGEISIDFVRNKASNTFKNSKYKQEMIVQRHAVAAWIERLISD